MTLYFDRQGNPLRMMQWAKLVEDHNYKRVAQTDLPSGHIVSTLWLGLDHGHHGKRLIFETMVFGPSGEGDLDQERYATEAEALAGHEEMVKKWATHH